MSESNLYASAGNGAPVLGITYASTPEDLRNASAGARVVVAPTQPPTTQEVQSTAEGIVGQANDANMLEFMGEKFRISSKIGLMPLLKFAHTAKQGADSQDMEGMDALYTIVRDCVDGAEEWQRFEDYATRMKADDEDLMPFVQRVIALAAARPTRQPANSSGGPATTSAGLKGSSSSPDTAGLVAVSDLAR